MRTYYHGTGYKSAEAILSNGIEIREGSGSTFGDGLYLCEELQDAKEFGMVALSIEVDETEMYSTFILEDEIEYSDEWGEDFSKSVLEKGYRGAKIEREDGFVETVIYDLSCLGEIKEVYRSSL